MIRIGIRKKGTESIEAKARCALCPKSFDMENMGESAIQSHMKGKIHKKADDEV